MSILWNGNAPSNILWSTGLSYVERDVGPINTWTIPSTTTDVVSYSGTNTISLNGKGGHYETCYKSFTVNKTGSYTISYDYDLPTINFYGTSSSHMHFGIYITTNQPPGGDMGTWSDYSTGNCNGTDICGPSSQYNTPGTGHVSFNYTLTAGTTYYLWVPMMNLADGVQTYLTFTNLNVKSVEQYYNTVEPELWWNGDKIWPVSPEPAISVWDGTYDYSWYNTTDTSFHLTTCAQFMAFAKLCNANSGGFSRDQFGGKTIYLDASMVINSDYANYASWGSSAPTYSMPNDSITFNGTLDGQFHSITGAYRINTSNWGGASLFSVSGSPTLKDLIIENYYFASDYAKLIEDSASTFNLEGVIFKNGIARMLNKAASEPTGPCIMIWEGSGSTVRTVNMSHCGAYNTVFDGAYKNSGSQVENWGVLISNNRFGSSFTAVHGVANMNNCFVCECDMIPTNSNTSRVKYYKISGAKTNTLTDCFEYDITARYGSNTPSTSVPTAQGTAASSTADLISRYNSANTVGKYTLKSDFTFQGN